MMHTLTTAFGSFVLNRYPEQSHKSLQAFDAADEYLLNELAAHPLANNLNILLLNDNFGALACSLANHYMVTSHTDSHLSELALYNNLSINQIDPQKVQFTPSTTPLNKVYDVVLIRIPKALALLEHQLITLQKHITPNTLVIAGAMIKHLPRAAGDLLEKYIGTVSASLAVKKARLLKTTVVNKPLATSPYPSAYTIKELNLTLTNHANVFCREGLDIGSRALLPYLPNQLQHAKVADLGCGNGVLGIMCARNNPQIELTLVDESYMAVASAQENWCRSFPNRPASIKVTDGLIAEQESSLDIILCNPPFHQQQVIGDFIAQRMFKQALYCLKEQGELWIVANRHLGYSQTLKKHFKQVIQINQTPKFIVLKSIK